MLSSSELKAVVRSAADAFVIELGNRFKEHVSNEFIVEYLVDKFADCYVERPEDEASYLAYLSAGYLFEYLLEGKCKVVCNGHHVAQQFCGYFREGPMTLISFKAEHNIHYSGK